VNPKKDSMIDFTLPEPTQELRDRVRAFVDDQVVPFERDPRLTQHGPNEELRTELVDLARKADLLSIQVPARFGGLDLSHVEQMVVFEAAGWSTMGPVAMNCAAPDEANMLILGLIADEAQQELYLRPVIDGSQRSVFAMTEPGGAGSDPAQLNTEAVRDGDGYVVNGRKWLITGANGARTWIVMAKLAADDRGPGGPTLFLTPGDAPGVEIERVMDTMDRNYVQGHGVVNLTDLRIPAEGLLGEEGQALRYAQMRLTPARLSHAARWLGAAVRAHTIAIDHARVRTAFGKPIGEHQGVGFMLADNEIALQQCRLAIWHAAWLLDQGTQDRHTSSMVKAYVSEELFKVADRCVQVLGGMGISDETPVAMIFRDLRAFRLYDGPTEVHKYAIARRLMRSGTGM
jgi:acyl-CoA dehydrogenase